MQRGLSCRHSAALVALWSMAALSMAALGCHEKRQASYEGSHIYEAKTPAELADKAAAVISAVCTRQSYATARVGLIAGETKLREDVFDLRDPVSYRTIPYRLGTTVRLEDLLRQGAEASGRPAAQAGCMRQFADHFKSLTDPLVEAARDEKGIDALAFKDAEKEAQQEIEMEEQQGQQ